MVLTYCETPLYGQAYTGRHVLITGGTGFIGRHLVAELLEQGARVRVLVRPRSEPPASWANVDICPGDLADKASLIRSCDDTEVVFHAAGFAHASTDPSPRMDERHWRINAQGTRFLVEAAAYTGVARLVFLSSVKAMGEGGRRCIDEEWPLPPVTAYGKAKRAAEEWVLGGSRDHGMHAVNLRLALVYGAGGRGNLKRLVDATRRGIFPPLPEVGNKHSMVHVTDVVRAALLAADHPAANQKTYIVTDGRNYSSRELYELICRGLGKRPPSWAVPMSVLRALARTGDLFGRLRGKRFGFDSEALNRLLGWTCYNSDKICRELGYRASHTLEESLPEILQTDSIAGKVR